ncbi:hypothetical protein [Thermococcus waiotapuensis]|uniref:Uncharacterized protein n=1 Tax=Thermococcus waiotapuensis TaxID=90909 RepID=A0AAE4T4E2_9EURY|nr:hypothetical protein [Thermococcus waiotapuensis]MDV3104813.1 hypothetical protein [Thermococcus waiotapuensis]
MDDKKIVLGTFIIVILISVMVYINGGASNVQEKHRLCSAGNLYVLLDVYYPGELRATGYEIKDDRIVLHFHSEGSGDLKVNHANFTISCIPENLSPGLFEVSVDGKTFRPSCEGVLTTPVPSKTSNSERSVWYLASPYNLSKIALIELPEGYSFRELNLENRTLVIKVSTGGNVGSTVVKSELLAEGWEKIIYTDGSSTWRGKKSVMGNGECPVWISPTS